MCFCLAKRAIIIEANKAQLPQEAM